MWSSWYRTKAAAVSRADHPSHGDQDVGSSIAAAFTRPHHSSSTPSGTLGDATTRWPAAYPPIAAVSGGCRRRQRWAKTGREGVPTGAPDERGAKGRHEVSGFTFDIAKALKRKGKRHSASVPSVP